jgi:hypothetical protein
MRQPPARDDKGWKPLDTLAPPLKSDATKTVWLLPRDQGLLPRQWVLPAGIDDVSRDEFTHWQDDC